MVIGKPVVKLVLIMLLMGNLMDSLQKDKTLSEVTKLPNFHHIFQKCLLYNTCARQTICRCDETCILHDDCCQDNDPTNFSKPFVPMTEYMSCMQMEWDGTTFVGNSFYVISQCPQSFSDEIIRTKCHRPEVNSVFDRIPVTSNRTLLTYRNKFCAQCHGLKKEEVYIWNILVHCKSFIEKPAQQVHLPEIIQSYLFTNSCGFSYTSYGTPYYRYQRQCSPSIQHVYVDGCPAGSDQGARRLCRKFYQPLFIYHKNTLLKYYKNKHCLQCDDTPVTSSILNSVDIKCHGPHTQINRFHSLLVMLNFSELLYEPGSLKSKTHPSCNEYEVYINKLEKCVLLHCPENSFAKYSLCVPYNKQMNFFAITALFYINGSVDGMIVREGLRKYTNDIAVKCGKYRPTSSDQANSISLLTGSDSGSNQSCMFAVMRQEFLHRLGDYTYAFHCIQLNLQKYREKLADDVIISFTDNVTSTSCLVNENDLVSSYKLTPFLGLQNETLTCPSIEIYALQNRMLTNRDEDESRYNSTKLYGINGIIVDAQNITVTSDGYFICWSVFKTYHDTSIAAEEKSVYTIITYVCMGVSILCLFVTMCHYCVVPKLLTNHSVILLHLVVITLLSHSVYMIGSHLDPDTDACWTVSIVLHCLFLAQFSSSSLALLQITKQLRSMKNPFEKKGIKLMLMRYVLTAYITSVSVVGVTVLVKHIKFSDEVWYGGKVCFISDPYALFYSFALPVAVSLLCNVGVFSFTIRFFWVSRFQQITMLTVNRNYFLLSLKLSMLLGISWLVGYIAVITYNTVLAVIYEVSTALHGVVLSIGILSNRAVINWYKAKCSCRNIHDRRAPSTTQTNHFSNSKT